MNKEQFEKVLHALLVVSAMAEALCGKRFVKRISKRFRVLSDEAIPEVWLGVYNFICRENTVHTGNVAMERSPIVRAETALILRKMNEKLEALGEDLDKVMETRIRSIIHRKEKEFNNEFNR